MTTFEQTNVSRADNETLDVKTSSYVLAYAWAAIFNAVLMILKESFPAVHNAMAALGHHWITHGVLDLIVFFGLGILFARNGKQISGNAAVNYLVWGTILGGGIIAGFFLLELV